MADRPRDPDRTPRWARVGGVIMAVLLLLVAVVLVTGGGRHGPARHTPPSSVAGAHPAPEGGDR